MVIRMMALCLYLTMLAGCSQMATIKETGEGRAPVTLIASDLVNALMQIDSLHPSEVRLQMVKPTHKFGTALQAVFHAAGYQVQLVTSRLGRNFVDYSESNTRGSLNAGLQSYQVSIGDVAVKRDYRIVQGRARPESHVYVRGADASSLTLNDRIFSVPATTPAKTPSPMAVPAARASEPAPLPASTQPSASAREITLVLSDPDANKSPLGRVNSPSTFSPGEPFTVSVSTSVESRVYCYYRDGNDNIIKLYPNRYSPDNRVSAGSLIEMPASDQWQLQATRSGYSDEVLCVAYAHASTDSADRFDQLKHPDLQPLSVATLDQILRQFNAVSDSVLMSQRVLIEVN